MYMIVNSTTKSLILNAAWKFKMLYVIVMLNIQLCSPEPFPLVAVVINPVYHTYHLAMVVGIQCCQWIFTMFSLEEDLSSVYKYNYFVKAVT